MRRKYTAVEDGMPPWRRHQRREAGDESERREVDGGGSVGPRTLEVEADVSVVEDGEPVIGKRRSQDVAAEAFRTMSRPMHLRPGVANMWL